LGGRSKRGAGKGTVTDRVGDGEGEENYSAYYLGRRKERNDESRGVEGMLWMPSTPTSEASGVIFLLLLLAEEEREEMGRRDCFMCDCLGS